MNRRLLVMLAIFVMWLTCVPLVSAQELILLPGLGDFPITAGALYSFLGAILFTGLVTEWLKKYLAEWRFINLVALAIAFVFEFFAGWIMTKAITAELTLTAFLLAFGAASVATFGYEMLFNLLGKLGVGRRSEGAIVTRAENLLGSVTHGPEVQHRK